MGKKNRIQSSGNRSIKSPNFPSRIPAVIHSRFAVNWIIRLTGLFVPLLIGIWIRIHFLDQTLQYDEAFTFLRFATLPYRELLGYYPLPNNHILHTALVKLSTQIFGTQEWAIRLPVFMAGITMFPLMYLLGQKVFRKGAGIWALSLASTSYGLAQYSVNARGYMLVCLFTAVVFLATLRIRDNGGTLKDWSLFVFGSVLGLFTVPVMLFPLAALSFWLIWDRNPAVSRRTVLRRLAVAWAVTGIGTALCYTPLLIDSGLDSLIANKYVQHQPIQEVLSRLPALAKSLLGYYLQAFPLPMQIILVLALIVGVRRLPRLALSILICTSCLLLIQRVIPPERALLFGLVFFLLFCAEGMYSIVVWLGSRLRLPEKFSVSPYLASVWAVAGAWYIFSLPYLAQPVESYPEAREVSSYLTGFIDNKTDFFAMMPEVEIITYYLSDKGRKDLEIPPENDPRTERMVMVANLRHGDVDSIMKKYPYKFVYYNRPQLLTRMDSTEIYLFKSVYREGLKPGAPLEYYVADFLRSKELPPDSLKNVHSAIDVLSRLKNYALIDSLLRKVLEIDSGNEYALENLGHLKIAEKQDDEAMEYFSRLRQVNPGHVAALCWSGILESRKQNYQEAERLLLQAAGIDSTDFNSLYNLGVVYTNTGDNRQAITWFKKALDRSPDDWETILRLAIAYTSFPEDREKALKLFRRAQEIQPGKRDIIERQFIQPLTYSKTDQ